MNKSPERLRTSQSGNSSKVSARSTSPKKKKKISKKQIAARLADEKRRKEEQEREAKERELMENAESESRAFERESKFQLEEKERREQEEVEMKTWEKQLEKNTEDWNKHLKDRESWKRFLESNKIVDAMKEAEVNTWINLWKEKENANIEGTLEDCQYAENIVKEMEHLILISNFMNDKKDETISNVVNTKRETIEALRVLAQRKIDYISAHLIQRADEYANSKNEVLLVSSTKDIEFGLWVNIAKNPRIKKIEFLPVTLSTDVPKNLALTSVAIRMMHFSFNSVSYKYLSSPLTLGGVVFLELLSLPPPPKKVKGWTLRQITPLSFTVSRLNYPPSVGIGIDSNPITTNATTMAQAGWPPLRITYTLPSNVIVRGEKPNVANWDTERNTWVTDSVLEVEYDKTNRQVAFKAMKIGAFSVIQDRLLDFPYENWTLRPTATNEAMLRIVTKQKKIIEIKIGEGFCRIVDSEDQETKYLEEGKFQPIDLIKHLMSSGVNIMPDEQVLNQLRDILNPKDGNLEKKLYMEISRLASSFSFSWTKWNNQKSLERKIVFLVKESLDYNEDVNIDASRWEEPVADEEDSAKMSEAQSNISTSGEVENTTPWKTCLYQERSCFLTKVHENSAKYNENLLPEAKLHHHLYHCVHDLVITDEADNRLKSASVGFIETVKSMLSLVRVVSTSK